MFRLSSYVARVVLRVAMQGSVHPATREVEAYLAEHAREWLEEIGCADPRSMVADRA